MGTRPRLPMARADRAKQFAPFSALKGLESAIERKRLLASTKRMPNEHEAEVLNDRLLRLCAGDRVYVMYFTRKGYIKRTVTVFDVDVTRRAILTDGEYIFFDDIYAIKSIG